ncbi:jg20339 [Pararge aegeria aegeria]|uniref:Jg20339 protein n=1 Tax=Pararge aegeria aegeria TaxID=348720 RepID=A0A8S4REN4_9NEOP|nr:jg20339 [Pararge aegeria aegeria]
MIFFFFFPWACLLLDRPEPSVFLVRSATGTAPRWVTPASRAHSRSLAGRPGRQVLQGVMLGTKVCCALLCYFSTSKQYLRDTAQAELSILAPEIICPKGGNNTFRRPDNSVIRLEMPRYTLKPGAYELECQLRNKSDGVLIKEVKVPINVYTGGLEVFLSEDLLIVSIDTSFTIESIIVNHDYYNYPVEYKWQCFNEVEPCDFVYNNNGSSLNFSSGIPRTGKYLIILTVAASNQSAYANATVLVVASSLPILQHGLAISETYTLFSLEENFLSELTDFSNDTESAVIEVDITSPGRARFVAECNCTSSSNCASIDVTTTYVEVHFRMNASPELEELLVTPETGSALESVFQIISRAKDFDRPLLYSFYCAIGPNVTLLLGSYLEYETVETFLPFVDGETLVWVEVCDAFGACSKSKPYIIQVRPSSGNTFELLIEYARAFIRRCEIMHMLHVAISGLISYKAASPSDVSDTSCRRRGRPIGKNRVPLSIKERRARNAQYERERRNETSEAMAELAEAAKCDAALSNSDILVTVISQLQRAAEMDSSRDIEELKRNNEKLTRQVEALEQRLSKWEDIHCSSSNEDEEKHTIGGKRKRKCNKKEKSAKVMKSRAESFFNSIKSGGAACGPILRAYLGTNHALLLGSLALGIIAMVKKESVMGGYELLPHPPSHMRTVGKWRGDYTYVPDPNDSKYKYFVATNKPI